MSPTPRRSVFEVIAEFLASQPTPQAILDYFLPDDLQERLDELLDKNGEDLLTTEEREEMVKYFHADSMFSLLKAKLRLKMMQEAAANLSEAG